MQTGSMDGPGQAWNLEAQDGEDGQVRDVMDGMVNNLPQA